MLQPSFNPNDNVEKSPFFSNEQHDKEGKNDADLETIPLYVNHFDELAKVTEKLFGVVIPSEEALHFALIKNELYGKVKEDLEENRYFALDFMIEEGLLTKKDLVMRGVRDLQDHARIILRTYKASRFVQAKKLFILAGIFTEKEMEEECNAIKLLH